MAEIAELRTYTSKTHDNGDESLTLEAHVGHIHYDDAGALQDVDLTFEDMGTYWRVTKASYKLYINKDFGASDLIRFDNRYEGANHSIYYEPHSVWWVNADDKSKRTKWKDAQDVTGTLNDDPIDALTGSVLILDDRVEVDDLSLRSGESRVEGWIHADLVGEQRYQAEQNERQANTLRSDADAFEKKSEFLSGIEDDTQRSGQHSKGCLGHAVARS